MEDNTKCDKPIYIDVTDNGAVATEDISDTVSIDYDSDGDICGVEITEHTGLDFDGEMVIGIKTDGINMDDKFEEYSVIREMVEKYGCVPGQVGIA
jgi:hypothetical protein